MKPFSPNKFLQFSLHDFLHDNFFNQWVEDSCDKSDGLQFELWLKENPQMLEVVEEARSMIYSFKDKPVSISDDFYIKLKSRIDTTISYSENNGVKDFKRKHVISRALQIAAVFVGLLIAGWLLFHRVEGDTFISYNSKYGETKTITLPDGSEVVLNANSFLKYKSSDDKVREVWLQGEGFFHIKHIEKEGEVPVKFVVHTTGVNVEVLGTQFNVNSNDGNETKVLLTTGKVRLSVAGDKTQPVIMSPNDMVNYNKTTKVICLNKVSPGNYISWMDHKYVFEKATLEDVSKELHFYYGTTIVIPNLQMRKQQISGTLELQDEETLIKTLSVLLGTNVTKRGDQITIGSK